MTVIDGLISCIGLVPRDLWIVIHLVEISPQSSGLGRPVRTLSRSSPQGSGLGRSASVLCLLHIFSPVD
jgi:hypothetical protein